MGDESSFLEEAFTGNPVTAVGRLREMLVRHAERASVWACMGVAEMICGHLEEATEAFAHALRLDPLDAMSRAYLGLALDFAGDAQAADDLLDYEGEVLEAELAVLGDPTALDAFHAELAQCLRAHPSASWEPEGKTTRRGWQTGELAHDTSPVVRQVMQALQRYLEDVLGDVPAGRAGWPVTAWATGLARGGFQGPHIHQAGIVSGVYYVQVPPIAGGSGCLRFPRQLPWLPFRSGRGPHLVRPTPGVVVTFPSWFWHETVPWESDAERICIAFDVLRHWKD